MKKQEQTNIHQRASQDIERIKKSLPNLLNNVSKDLDGISQRLLDGSDISEIAVKQRESTNRMKNKVNNLKDKYS